MRIRSLISPYITIILPIVFLIATNSFSIRVSHADEHTDAAEKSEKEEPLSKELISIQNLVRANVVELAEKTLLTQGPELKPTTEWLQWERQLWKVYQVQEKWYELYQRTQKLPSTFPASIRQEAMLQRAKALTELNQGTAARRLIREQLLITDISKKHKRLFRQALISSFIADDLLEEASAAVTRFNRDYTPDKEEWLLLSAGVLIQSGDPDAAINLLSPLQQPAAQLLRLYARLTNNTLNSKKVIDSALKILKSPQGESLVREVYSVTIQANIDAEEHSELVTVLEKYLITPTQRESVLSRSYPRFDAEDLFAAYTKIAEEEANESELLIGDDEVWFEHAEKLPEKSVVTKKSIFAFLAKNSQDKAIRQKAIDAYINALIDTKQPNLIEHLFGENALFGKLTLGGETGFRLATYALSKNYFKLAAIANANLVEFPPNLKRNEWLLLSARIDVFSGQYQSGVDKLNEWIDSFKKFTKPQATAVLQPIFDLQSVEQHEFALKLLKKVSKRITTKQQRREISFWLAESYVANKQYRIAADLFLKSALAGKESFDQWGQAARFRAGEALIKLELYNDAIRIFEDLLLGAGEQSWKDRLNQKLQQLWLLQSSDDEKKSESRNQLKQKIRNQSRDPSEDDK